MQVLTPAQEFAFISSFPHDERAVARAQDSLKGQSADSPVLRIPDCPLITVRPSSLVDGTPFILQRRGSQCTLAVAGDFLKLLLESSSVLSLEFTCMEGCKFVRIREGQRGSQCLEEIFTSVLLVWVRFGRTA